MREKDDYKISVENFITSNKIIPRCYEILYISDSNTIKVIIHDDEDKSKNIYLGNGLIGRWCCENDKYILFFQVNISGNKDEYNKIKGKNRIVRESIPTMISSLVKADKEFFRRNNNLREAEIFIKFNCKHDDFFKVENWGRLDSYVSVKTRSTDKEESYKDKADDLREKNNNIITNLLNPYIELFLSPIYGINIKYLIKNIDILSMDEISNILSDENKTHEIVLSIKVMNNNILEETILSALITRRGVVISLIA